MEDFQRVVEDFQRVVELFLKNTKDCINGPIKEYFAKNTKFYPNMDILNTLGSFFVGRRKEQLVLIDDRTGLLFCRDPKIIGRGKNGSRSDLG